MKLRRSRCITTVTCIFVHITLVINATLRVDGFSPSQYSNHDEIVGNKSSDQKRTTTVKLCYNDDDDNVRSVKPFIYSPTSLKHLENTELPDDYSRPWTPTKIKALATGIAVGVITGTGGEIIFQKIAGIEKTFVLFGALGIAAGWYVGGGQEVTQSEKPINGGYDRKLIADRPGRMKSVLKTLIENNMINEDDGLKTTLSNTELSEDRDLSLARKYSEKIHGVDYVSMLEKRSSEADRPERLNPMYSRTLIDQHSFVAALNAAADWIQSVENAAENLPPKFALVRPPSHHACRNKGMGGCLLNSVAIAARYALDLPGIDRVAILDVDAHHGNGIAHCIQDMSSIQYCSIHEDCTSAYSGRSNRGEDTENPRSPIADDQGPLKNIRNINVPAGTTWENGYQQAFQEQAIPFLKASKPDIILVAAGFDALEADLTSKLKLQPHDFRTMAGILRHNFGNRIASGLEGGYCWQGGELNEALLEFIRPMV